MTSVVNLSTVRHILLDTPCRLPTLSICLSWNPPAMQHRLHSGVGMMTEGGDDRCLDNPVRAVSFTGFRALNCRPIQLLERNFHLGGHRPQQGGPGPPMPPVATRLVLYQYIIVQSVFTGVTVFYFVLRWRSIFYKRTNIMQNRSVSTYFMHKHCHSLLTEKLK